MNDLLGLARMHDEFGVICLKEQMVRNCLKVCGSFIVRLVELLKVIEDEVKGFQEFISWLEQSACCFSSLL